MRASRLRLIDAWEGAGTSVLADAISSGAAAGTVRRLDASAQRAPAASSFALRPTHSALPRRSSSPAPSGRLPQGLVVYGVEGASFEIGDELTAEVRNGSEQAAAAIREEVLACTNRR